jgi:hemerythrin-like domain-containing protein
MIDPSTVTALLQDDHERLDALVDDLRTSVAKAAFAEAREGFVAFASGLRRHIDVEEQVLFPAFEAATGMRSHGPTAVMRAEHADIRRLLDRTAAALEKADATALGEATDALTALLAEHDQKEEHVLYPMTDRVLGAGAGQLVETLRAGLRASSAG